MLLHDINCYVHILLRNLSIRISKQPVKYMMLPNRIWTVNNM